MLEMSTVLSNAGIHYLPHVISSLGYFVVVQQVNVVVFVQIFF